MYKKSISIIKTKKKLRHKKTQNKKKVYNKKTKYLLQGSGNNSIQKQLELEILHESIYTKAANNENIVGINILNEKKFDEIKFDETKINETKTILSDYILAGETYKTIFINAVDVSLPPPGSEDEIKAIRNNTKLDNTEKKNLEAKIYEDYYQQKTTESYKNIFNEFYNYIKSKSSKPPITLNLIIVLFKRQESVLHYLTQNIIIKAIYESFLESNLPKIDSTTYSVKLNEMNFYKFTDLKKAQIDYLKQKSTEKITSVNNVIAKTTNTPKSICELLK